VWVIVHLVVGLALGAALEAPFWVLVLAAVGSHIVLDLIPHWDYTHSSHDMLYGWLDFAVCCALLVACPLVWHTGFGVLAVGVISASPDVDVLVHTLRGEKGRYWFPSHWNAFPHGACGPLPGITVQAAVIAAATAVFMLAGGRSAAGRAAGRAGPPSGSWPTRSSRPPA
jgi:hypothetical protein